MSGENVDSIQGGEEVKTETEFVVSDNGPDLLENQHEFNDDDYDPELEEDPEKIQCFECKGHGEYDDKICESCVGMGYVLRNDVLLNIKENLEINQELLISLISILHPLTKAFHDGSLNRNDLARKGFMNSAGIANEVYTKIIMENKSEDNSEE